MYPVAWCVQENCYGNESIEHIAKHQEKTMANEQKQLNCYMQIRIKDPFSVK